MADPMAENTNWPVVSSMTLGVPVVPDVATTQRGWLNGQGLAGGASSGSPSGAEVRK